MHWFPPLIVFLGLSLATAQDLRTELKVGEGPALSPRQTPEVKKAQALMEESPAAFNGQDAATLDSNRLAEDADQEIPEMDSLRENSVYHAILHKGELPISSVQGDRLGKDLQKVSAVYRKAGQQDKDCLHISLSVVQRVKKDPDSVLQVVDAELRANPGCSCEIVKSAISETDMEVETVVGIVKVAFEASPEHIRLIAQCAIAACPEALSAIQDVVAKYEKSTGTGDSAKSAKSAKGERATIFSGDEVAATPNPLDFPGGPNGHNITFFQPPLLIITPSVTTSVDP